MNVAKHKINAFTLSEMMVVLVITVIVVSLAFAVLQLVQKQMIGMQHNYEKNTKENQLRQALWIDFRTYSTFNYDAAHQRLYCQNELSSISYEFYENQIIRQKDTFAIELDEYKFFFDNQKVDGGPVDALMLQMQKKTKEKRMFVFKNNTASDYMN